MSNLLPGELRVISRLPLLEPKVLVDVGSSFEEYSLAMQEVCPLAQIYSFDPQSGTPAIGKENGTLEMTLYPTAPARGSGVKAYTDNVSGPFLKRIVPLCRLDTLLPGVQIDFLKADVEGMEWDVLQGLGSLRPRLIQFEYSWATEFTGKSWDDFKKFFQGWGYVMRELDFVGSEDAQSCFYNFLAGPNSLVEKFF